MTRQYQKQWEVPSESSDKVYKVSLTMEGEYICHCWPFLRTREECKHIHLVKLGLVNECGQILKRKIVLAMVDQVKICGDKLYTPLIPIENIWFQTTVLYDLLRGGISWGELKERYSLAKMNTKQAVVEYIKQHGRLIYNEADMDGFGHTGMLTTDADEPLPILKEEL